MHIFHAMGYHLGSELLADKEFPIDDFLQKDFLIYSSPSQNERAFLIGDKEHNGYTWLHTHSGHGNAVEADHFAYAMRGIDLAYHYLPKSQEEEMTYHLIEGFSSLLVTTKNFFTRMLEDIENE